MEDESIDDLKCDILLFFATQTEREQLAKGADEFGVSFEQKSSAQIGEYYNLGTIGSNRVRAVKTRMGPFFHQGSASQAIVLLAATSATSIIQVGMAFGIDREVQRHGDVLVSNWLFPYDYRIIEHLSGEGGQPDGYSIDYRDTRKFRAKESLLRMFELERTQGGYAFNVYFGGMLSGGSRIFSQIFLRELLSDITGSEGPGGYVGGEMEGVGLLSARGRSEPVWAVVKGISDFADDLRHAEIADMRPQACLNAVRFVFGALHRVKSILAE